VFCVGLSEEISAPEVHYALVKVLGQHKYLGQYGKIEKISTNRNNFSNKNQKGPSFSTYITFSNNLSAALAILVTPSPYPPGPEQPHRRITDDPRLLRHHQVLHLLPETAGVPEPPRLFFPACPREGK
jgi:hypothetical protein